VNSIKVLLSNLVSADDSHATAMKKAGLSLAVFAFISVFFVAITDKLTAGKIAENQAAMLLNALNEIAPQNSYDNDLIASKVIVNKTEFNKTKSNKSTIGFMSNTPVYLATKNGQAATAIFEVTTNKGYSGAITLLVGISASSQTVTGVRVVKHKETPGLGDKMEIKKTPPNKTPWVLDFNNKSLSNPELSAWNVKKDNGEFDQFTGATITPRAIVNAVKSTLLYAQDNMNALFTIETQSIKTNQESN
jgi:electron transport complex protein RnfG